jgi:hypothetical protein
VKRIRSVVALDRRSVVVRIIDLTPAGVHALGVDGLAHLTVERTR